MHQVSGKVERVPDPAGPQSTRLQVFACAFDPADLAALRSAILAERSPGTIVQLTPVQKSHAELHEFHVSTSGPRRLDLDSDGDPLGCDSLSRHSYDLSVHTIHPQTPLTCVVCS
eukprot:gnl/Hemi2/19126_TR6343_c0_g1_i1.p1 gnl/Hemi2/19126_TR6343_c0_g1~~gnl/Hemi2/19126_TR6343_c0_g1_i1.p1  ORF type:complete len:115 (+),score=9.81 gnl/Hemi2/19126_TR6343_c0_g1_i1:101-445(+)